MKITLAPFGTSSDVLPMIALAKTLQSRGHVVTLCAPEEFRSRIYKAEIPMVSSGQTYRNYLDCEKGMEDATFDLVSKLGEDMAMHFVALRDAGREADILIGSRLQLAGPSLAEERRIPYFYAVTTPGNADLDSFPTFGVPAGRAQKRRSKRIKEWDRHVLTALNRERKIAHLDPVANLFEYLYRAGNVFLAVDPAFRSNRNLPNQIQTGFWFLDREIDLEPETISYLSSGAPPIYIAPFRVQDPTMILSLCRSLTGAGHRTVLAPGWDALSQSEIPEGTQRLDSLSYAEIFPRMAAIVHSGSPDLTMYAVRAKLPQVIVPYTIEQMYWAEKCRSLGLSAAPVLNPDVEYLQKIITGVLSDQTIRQRLERFAVEGNGTETAADAIEKGLDQL